MRLAVSAVGTRRDGPAQSQVEGSEGPTAACKLARRRGTGRGPVEVDDVVAYEVATFIM